MTFGLYLPARKAGEVYCESVGITICFPKV
jgi:hypothetical protein